MANTIIRFDGTTKTVKNLGWLIRHLGIYHVHSVSVWTSSGQGATLYVHFYGGVDFASDFSSAVVLREWLKARRNLRGVRLVWDGREEAI